jgi:hypothetical protein
LGRPHDNQTRRVAELGDDVKLRGGSLLAASLLWNGSPALAHHSYAMFDLEHKVNVSGTIAKVEWSNPHVFIWMYVANAKGGYDLYGFEAGAVSLLTRYGWSKTTAKTGEKVSIEYFPLKDKRPGGAFINMTHADGTVTRTEPFAPGGTDPSAYRIDHPQQKDQP